MGELLRPGNIDASGGLTRRLRDVFQRKVQNTTPLVTGDVILPGEDWFQDENHKTSLTSKKRGTLIPEELIETDTLAQLKIGETAYTVPWAMAVTELGECYLNGDYTFHQEPGGTIQMLIRKTKDGYEVEVPQGYKYQPSRNNPWVGGTDERLLPVNKVKKGTRSY